MEKPKNLKTKKRKAWIVVHHGLSYPNDVQFFTDEAKLFKAFDERDLTLGICRVIEVETSAPTTISFVNKELVEKIRFKD